MDKKKRISLKKIEKELKKEEEDIKDIERDVSKIKEEILEKEPPHFSKRDIINAFFGALIVGLAFVFKGSLMDTVWVLPVNHLVLIIISTLLILSVQIYFISYSKVKNKRHRPFPQFLIKRLTTLYIIALIVSFYLVYIFNLDHAMGNFLNAIKFVVVLSMPCSIGASVPGLLKRY